jgi:hypothetical protein
MQLQYWPPIDILVRRVVFFHGVPPTFMGKSMGLNFVPVRTAFYKLTIKVLGIGYIIWHDVDRAACKYTKRDKLLYLYQTCTHYVAYQKVNNNNLKFSTNRVIHYGANRAIFVNVVSFLLHLSCDMVFSAVTLLGIRKNPCYDDWHAKPKWCLWSCVRVLATQTCPLKTKHMN